MHLYAKTLGDSHAETILFISGFVGSHRVWDENFLQLSTRFRLILIDSLGFGQSPRPDIEYSVAEHVEAITTTLRALGVMRTHVVGHSMGCLLGLAFANQQPAMVDRLALLALPLFESESQARHTIKAVSLFNRWLAMDTPVAELACRVMCGLRPLLAPLAPRLVSGVPALVAKDALLHSWNSYSRTLRNVIFRGTPRRWLQELERDLLLIHGTADTTAPFANVQNIGVAMHARLVTLPADHGLIFTHGAVIAAALLEFFAPGAATADASSKP